MTQTVACVIRMASIPNDQVQVRRAGEVTNDGVPHSCRLVSANNVVVGTALRCYFHVLRYSNQRRPPQQRTECLRSKGEPCVEDPQEHYK